MSDPRVPVEKSLPKDLSYLTPAQADAVLEVAYLAIAADSRLAEEEIDGFERIAALLPGKRDASALLDRFANLADKDGPEARLAVVVKQLSDPRSRGVAYRAACALALVDLDAGDREFEFDLELISALGLSQDDADALADEVNAALIVEE